LLIYLIFNYKYSNNYSTTLTFLNISYPGFRLISNYCCFKNVLQQQFSLFSDSEQKTNDLQRDEMPPEFGLLVGKVA